MAQRDPGKQVNIERTLQGLKKGSSAYSNIQQKILAGTYRTSKALKEQNIKELMKTRARLTKKIDQGKSQQEKGNLGKIEKINKLLPILEDETNVESEPEVVPVQVKPIQLPIPTPEFLNALEAEEGRLGSAAVQAPAPEVPVPAPAVQASVSEVQAPVPEVQAPVPEVQAPVPQQNPLTQSVENPEELLKVQEVYKEDNTYKERLLYLNEKLEKCREECEQIRKEKKDLDDFIIKKQIEGITLSRDKKLIDLLIERVLDISPKWKDNIDTLINIPTGLKGKGFLRGGDYFEAFFQLAIAIGILPKFSNKFVRFYYMEC
jgi:hypothetical protein